MALQRTQLEILLVFNPWKLLGYSIS